MKKTLLILCATVFSTALSPLEENVEGKMLPQIVDDAVKPYYEQVPPEQRNCEGMPPKAIRVVRPGDMITMDHSATRLNIEIDAQDHFIRAYCG